MNELIVHLRIMQTLAHAAHNLVSGPQFFEDHEFFGDAYPQHEADFDSVVERSIGTLGENSVDFAKIAEEVSHFMKMHKANISTDNKSFLQIQLNLEEELCRIINALVPQSSSQGTINMIAGIADMSEVRQYKLKQRLKA